MAGSVIGAVASSVIGAKAGKAQAQAADRASEVQQYMYDTTREDLAPYRTSGYAANTRLSQLMGLDTFDRDAIAESLNLTRENESSSALGDGFPEGIVPADLRSGQLRYDDPRQLDVMNLQRFEIDPYMLTAQQRQALEPFALGQERSGARGAAIREYAVPSDIYGKAAPSWSGGTQGTQSFADALVGGLGDSPFGGGSSAGSTSSGSADIEAQIDAEIARLKGDSSFGSLAKKFSLDDFEADPGYQFRKDEGNKGVSAMQSARGNMFSGQALKEAARFNSGLASQEYGAAFGRDDTEKNRLYNQLAGISNTGMGAVNSGINQGQSYANQMSNIYGQLGNAQASQAINQGNNISQGMAGLFGGSSYSAPDFEATGGFNPSAFLKSGLPWSDIRLKKDVKEAGEESGHKLYTFRYKGDPEGRLFKGVMAQDVMETKPEAVVKIGNYYAVDYSQLGVEFKEVA